METVQGLIFLAGVIDVVDPILTFFRWLWANAMDIAAVIGIASAAVRALEDGTRELVKKHPEKQWVRRVAWAVEYFDGFLGFCVRALYVVALTRRKTVLPPEGKA